jgi:peptidoglycan hydrolase CwlO-like protein
VDNVHRIMASQSDLKAACETIEAYQAELDNDLAALSENLDLELEALQLQVRALCAVFVLRVWPVLDIGVTPE